MLSLFKKKEKFVNIRVFSKSIDPKTLKEIGDYETQMIFNVQLDNRGLGRIDSSVGAYGVEVTLEKP